MGFHISPFSLPPLLLLILFFLVYFSINVYPDPHPKCVPASLRTTFSSSRSYVFRSFLCTIFLHDFLVRFQVHLISNNVCRAMFSSFYRKFNLFGLMMDFFPLFLLTSTCHFGLRTFQNSFFDISQLFTVPWWWCQCPRSRMYVSDFFKLPKMFFYPRIRIFFLKGAKKRNLIVESQTQHTKKGEYFAITILSGKATPLNKIYLYFPALYSSSSFISIAIEWA